jgi:signal transduction histidine kinase
VTIRLRLALVYVATVTVLVVGMGAVTYAVVRSNLRANARGDAQQLARTAAALEDPGELSLDRIAGPGVHVWVTDGSGRVVAQSHPAGPAAGTLGAVNRMVASAPGASTSARARRAGGGVAIVLLANEAIDSSLSTLLSALVAVGLGVIVVAAVAGWLLARRALEPIDRMRREVDDIPGDALERRIVEGRADELGRLARAFNRLLARVQEATEQQQRFIADASHELRTPVTAIQGHARIVDRAAERGDLDQARESARLIAQTSGRLARTVSELLSLAATPGAAAHEPVRLDDVASEACDELRAVHPGRPIDAALSETVVSGDAGRLGELVRILLDNALKYSPADRPVAVTVGTDGAAARLEVRDGGPGLSDDDRRRAFERFYRGSRAHGTDGSGLGLSIAQAIAMQHGGQLRLEEVPGGGTLAVATFPLRARGAGRAAAGERPPASLTGRPDQA